MLQAAGLFNSASLDVVLVASPRLIAASPPPTSLGALDDDELVVRTDTWVSALLAAPRRPRLYYDERLTLHLVVSLAGPSSSAESPALNRAQAATLLLRSLSTPHLALAADLSYVDAAAAAPPPLPARSSSLAARVPQAPALVPDTQHEVPSILVAQDAALQGGVHVASMQFSDGDGARVWVAKGTNEGDWVGVWELTCDVAHVRSQLREPRLSITMTVTLRDDPKLDPLLERAKEGIVSGRGANGRELTDELLDADGEYMEDSYDDVNLLSALAPISSVPLHLPFSRLPPSYLPPLPPPSLPAPRTRASSVSHTRTLSAGSSTGVAPDELHHPSLRRSIRRVLPIRPALQLELRTVLCPVGALGLPAARTDTDADDEAGVLLCVEVRGPPRTSSSAPSEQEAFDIEHIDVLVEGAASASPAAGFGSGSGSGAGGPVGAAVSDIDVRAVALDRLSWPVRVTGGAGGEQHNFVYALAGVAAPAMGAASAHLPLIRHVDSEGDGHVGAGVRTVPREVAASPQQRFAARFGAEEAVTGAGAGLLGPVRQGGRRGSQAPVAGKEGDPRWLRDVTVVVRGRPVVHRQKGATAGYSVPDATDAEETDEDESPTPAFLSRWQCTLDISSFARRSPPRRAAFAHPSAAIPRPTSIGPVALAPLSHMRLSMPSSRSALAPAANIEVESIAGSKRHTMSSLAALSLRAPNVARRTSLGLAPTPSSVRQSADRAQPTRALPPTPHSPPTTLAPAPSHAGKRFFSLPHPHPHDGTGSASAPPLAHVATPVRTETPGPAHSAKGVSLTPARGASAGALLETRPKEVRRTSWISGLVPGGTADSSSAEPALGGTSWSAQLAPTLAPGVGLGLDDPSLPSGMEDGDAALLELEPEQELQPMGKLLVSVSLVPLRAAKSRRAPPPFTGAVEGSISSTAAGVGRTNENLPPAALPGLAAPDRSGHATPRFAFPPSPTPSASPLPSPSLASVSPPAGAGDNADGEAALRALAERTNLATSRMPRVNVLDVFLVEVFVFNRSSVVKRLTVGIPPAPVAPVGEAGDTRRGQATREDKVAKLVPLENDVRIGPLAPNSCASVGIRFLAIRPGAHVVDELRLVDLADGSETRLERPVWVVVE